MSTREGGGRGGYQRPANPAPVSGPGALSARTDGGPGDRQPIRLPSGGRYGERQALESQQQGAPMAAASETGAAGGPPTTVEERTAPEGPGGIFGPTQRPDEPITAGVYPSSTQGFEEPELTSDDILRQMYALRPSPWLLRLIRDE